MPKGSSKETGKVDQTAARESAAPSLGDPKLSAGEHDLLAGVYILLIKHHSASPSTPLAVRQKQPPKQVLHHVVVDLSGKWDCCLVCSK